MRKCYGGLDTEEIAAPPPAWATGIDKLDFVRQRYSQPVREWSTVLQNAAVAARETGTGAPVAIRRIFAFINEPLVALGTALGAPAVVIPYIGVAVMTASVITILYANRHRLRAVVVAVLRFVTRFIRRDRIVENVVPVEVELPEIEHEIS